MDFIEEQKFISKITLKNRQLAEEYRKAREAYGIAKQNLLILLIPKQEDSAFRKASLEKQLLMLCLQEPGAMNDLKQFIYQEQCYKGIERIIQANESTISCRQSLWRWARDEGG